MAANVAAIAWSKADIGGRDVSTADEGFASGADWPFNVVLI